MAAFREHELICAVPSKNWSLFIYWRILTAWLQMVSIVLTFGAANEGKGKRVAPAAAETMRRVLEGKECSL